MDFSLPELGEGVYEAELVRWLVKPGDTVKRGQNLLEVLTDKATMEVPAPFAGTINSIAGEIGQRLKVGEVDSDVHAAAAVRIRCPPSWSSARLPSLATVQSQLRTGRRSAVNGRSSPPSAASTAPVAAPSVRHLARKLGIDLANVHGSGPPGRILIDDLTSHDRAASAKASGREEQPLELDFGVPGTRVRLQGLRRKIAEHMVDAKRPIPHYTYVDECDVTELVKLRASLREPCASRGSKLTYLAFFVKAVARRSRKCRSSTVRSTRARRRSCCTIATTSASPWRRRPAWSCRWSTMPTRRTSARSPREIDRLGAKPRPAESSSTTCAAARSPSRRSATSAA